ncbi:hypothetical protein FACS189454_03380 [Planctomycetales bacterium]|nr:hypothetical protein FACS189454_03380 [Planctomycetales bacterium]
MEKTFFILGRNIITSVVAVRRAINNTNPATGGDATYSWFVVTGYIGLVAQTDVNLDDRVNSPAALFGIGAFDARELNEPGHGQVALAEATDGLSNTVAFSELIQTVSNPDTYGGPTKQSDHRGFVQFAPLFTTYYEPNTTQEDELMNAFYCHAAGNPLTPKCPCVGHQYLAVVQPVRSQRLSARSYHLGGVQAAYGDASVHFVSDVIRSSFITVFL